MNPTRVGLYEPHDRVEARRLARTVGAEKAKDFSMADRQRNVLEHRAPVIGFGDRDDRQSPSSPRCTLV